MTHRVFGRNSNPGRISRRFWQVWSSQTADTLVELLVTIVIATIVFAALVPLFAEATQKNSADLFRQTALNIAQARIEQIRALDYGSITTANLNSTSFVDKTFGQTARIGAGGSLRTFNISYDVTDDTTFKVVTVTVTWTAPPAPVKPIVLQTIVYRQYAGPTLASFYTTPAVSDSGVLGDASLAIVTLSAVPTTTWLGGKTASVQFEVYNSAGTAVGSQTVTYATDGTAGWGTTYGVSGNTFWWNWDSTGLPDGTYSVSAAGFSGTYYGPTWTFYFTIARGTALLAPQNLTASPGQSTVALNWSAVAGAVSYNVYRWNTGTATWGTPIGSATTPNYTDSGLIASTTYTYKVAGVDNKSKEGAAATVSATTTSSGSTLPTDPLNLVAAGDSPSAGDITLTWYQPNSWGSSPFEYLIESNTTNSTTGWASVSTMPWDSPPYPDQTQSYSYSDSVGPAKTLYFRVTALATGGVAGGVSNIASASTAALTNPNQTLTVTNNSTGNGNGLDVYVQVYNVSTGIYYDQNGVQGVAYPKGQLPAGVDVPNSSSVLFNNLPNPNGANGDKYDVVVSDNSGMSHSSLIGVTIKGASATALVQH